MFIETACRRAHDMKDPELAACIAGETDAYRATVMLLTDVALGDAAAARYRSCQTARDGWFHREKAACVAETDNG